MDVSKITVNAQNSIRIDAGKVIYIDPFEIKESNNDADYIFITHDHYDHFSPESIEKIIKADTVIVVPEPMAKKRKYLIKMPDLNANDIEAAMKMIEGTARSMGIEIVR